MTHHINAPTATTRTLRPTEAGRSMPPTTRTHGVASSKRPMQHWVAAAGVVVAVGAVGLALASNDAADDVAGGSAGASVVAGTATALDGGQRLQSGLPDGYWRAVSSTSPVARTAVSEVPTEGWALRPGRPDGYWQPESDNRSTSVTVECRISEPC